ncbi:E3 ubiquitin-protein ligase [Lachnellula occidentalis]|uniref:E3 ubiquitin-protein ligase n=1 Tax=Lachnellula occidentalis TaxID=215460 RepID=A0A8H8S2T5_9HELO|nr:E3 ubiquitin-protein ligase [Lachnellula occidentalis]
MTTPEAAGEDSRRNETSDLKLEAGLFQTYNQNYHDQGGAATTVRQAERAGWEWPRDMATEPSHEERIPLPGAFKDEPEPPIEPVEEEHVEGQDNTAPPPRRRYYKPRQCRICLEEVLPSFETPSEGIGAFLNPSPKVSYISEDPESGRLLRPCKCTGSQAYVHEGCLQAWRHADPRYGDRNFWDCPTCKFRYRLERMKWSRMISSTLTQVVLTIFIMFATVFLLGFVADPIMNLYFEPGATIASVATGGGIGGPLDFEEELAEYDGWVMHFMKGLTSIGVLGFVKVIWAMSPVTIWNFRGGLFGSGGRSGRVRAGVTGRDRTDSTFWLLVIVGVVTFLYTIWTWVRRWSRRTLEKASERVVDVHGDDPDDDDDEAQAEETPRPHPDINTQTAGASSSDQDAGSRKTQ